jgi:hypothetical protein
MGRYALGYIAGAIYGDGWVNTRLLKNKAYRIDFYNKDEEYLGVFLTFLHIFFDFQISYRRNCYTITINSKRLWNLLSPYKYKSRYKIPNWLTTEEEKAGFISGLFDTDGCVYKKNIPLCLTSKYIENLYQIQSILNDFGIASHIKPIYKDSLARLYIKGYENKKIFSEKINFHHPQKIKTMKKILEDTYTFRKRKIGLSSRIQKLYKQGKSVGEIKKILNIPQTTVICWLDEIDLQRKKRHTRGYSPKEYFSALKLLKMGINRYEVSKRLGIPASTLFYWLNTDIKPVSVRGV